MSSVEQSEWAVYLKDDIYETAMGEAGIDSPLELGQSRIASGICDLRDIEGSVMVVTVELTSIIDDSGEESHGYSMHLVFPKDKLLQTENRDRIPEDQDINVLREYVEYSGYDTKEINALDDETARTLRYIIGRTVFSLGSTQLHVKTFWNAGAVEFNWDGTNPFGLGESDRHELE